MPTDHPNLKQITIGRTRRFYQEADGTRYDILAIELPKGINFGYNCQTEPALLIISGYDKTAYTFAQKGYLSWDYVMEKLCKWQLPTDAKHLTELIEQAKKWITNESET